MGLHHAYVHGALDCKCKGYTNAIIVGKHGSSFKGGAIC